MTLCAGITRAVLSGGFRLMQSAGPDVYKGCSFRAQRAHRCICAVLLGVVWSHCGLLGERHVQPHWLNQLLYRVFE